MGNATHDAVANAVEPTASSDQVRRAVWFGSGSLFISAFGALCAFLIALSKLGILLAVASFLSSAIASRYHADQVRLPVLSVAFIAALTNLFVLWNWNRLRNAPAAAWRKKPLSARQRRHIVLVIATSAATIALVVGEFCIHPIHLF